jgi:hypothetical protein
VDSSAGGMARSATAAHGDLPGVGCLAVSRVRSHPL